MALGGGTFTTQNKVLPGSYINFVSAARASATLSERGVVALPIALDWGKQGEVFTITAEDFQKNSLKLLGHAYSDSALMPFREIFKNATKVHVFNINSGGAKATSTLATAKHPGTIGNNLRYVIEKNVDDASMFDVSLYMQTASTQTLLDSQTVSNASQLIDNDFVTWNTSGTLELTSATPLTDGTDGSSDNAGWQNALNMFESYNFNTLACSSTDETITALFVEFTKRMRDKMGVKFQTVVYQTAADYEGIVSLENATEGSESALIYWTAGALAGCAINKSCTNKLYDGELTVLCPHTQTELEAGIKAGKFMFHKVEDEVRILTDINTLLTYTDTKGDIFSMNQVIRVIDQCGNDTASTFNTKYLGRIQNDAAGRISFWNDIVTHRRELETLRAIENYDSSLLTVAQGDTKTSVVVNEVITVTCVMEKLYMTITIQ